MTTASSRLLGIRAKIERAKKHIAELEARLKAFHQTEAYTIVAQEEPSTGTFFAYVDKINPAPPEIVLAAGDAIHNLRAALDHLALQLVESAGASFTTQTGFPIFDSLALYQANSADKVKGMSTAAAKAIDAIEPYQGGEGHRLWILHRLDITDKHRLLFATASYSAHVDLGPLIAADFPRAFGNLSFPIIPADKRHLKVGDVLFSGIPKREVAEKMKVSIAMSFGESQITTPEPLIETIHHFYDLVNEVVGRLAVFL